MNDREAFEFYADPEHRRVTGPGRKRHAPRLSGMLPVRFTPEVIEAVKSRAFTDGYTVSAWIRRLVGREIARPAGLIEDSGRPGEPKALSSSPVLQPRTFACRHLSVSNVSWAECPTCGPMWVVA